MVAALLNAGADPNARNRKGWTPLHHGALYRRAPLAVTALLLAGADPNAQAGDGKTPLHVAAGNGHAPWMVPLLLDRRGRSRRARPGTARRRCTMRRSTMHRLRRSRTWSRRAPTPMPGTGTAPRRSIARPPSAGAPRHLSHCCRRAPTRAHGRPTGSCRWTWYATTQLSGIPRLLAAGADPDRQDVYGDAPLHDAVEDAGPAVVRMILAAGADASARDGKGRTPLHRARSRGAVRALLDAGAGLEIRDGRGRTPLHAAPPTMPSFGPCSTPAPIRRRGTGTAGRRCILLRSAGRSPMRSAPFWPPARTSMQGTAAACRR